MFSTLGADAHRRQGLEGAPHTINSMENSNSTTVYLSLSPLLDPYQERIASVAQGRYLQCPVAICLSVNVPHCPSERHFVLGGALFDEGSVPSLSGADAHLQLYRHLGEGCRKYPLAIECGAGDTLWHPGSTIQCFSFRRRDSVPECLALTMVACNDVSVEYIRRHPSSTWAKTVFTNAESVAAQLCLWNHPDVRIWGIHYGSDYASTDIGGLTHCPLRDAFLNAFASNSFFLELQFSGGCDCLLRRESEHIWARLFGARSVFPLVNEQIGADEVHAFLRSPSMSRPLAWVFQRDVDSGQIRVMDTLGITTIGCPAYLQNRYALMEWFFKNL